MRLLRNTIDFVSVGLILWGAYVVDVGLLMMVVGVIGLIVMWRTDRNRK